MPLFWRCPSISLSYSLGLAAAGRGCPLPLEAAVHPCIVASVLGLVLALTRLAAAGPGGRDAGLCGRHHRAAVPAGGGLLLAGMSAGQVLRSPKLWLLTAIRLLLLPVALCLVLRALGIDSLVLGIAVTQMAMPVAVNGTLLSMEYGGDTECMAQITFLTTAASIVTIPIVAVLLLPELRKETNMPHIQQLESHVADLTRRR
ncbi:MAG: AEC family transporter [Oscillibacter sp.]